MAQQTINVGTAPNDGTGTPLRTAFQYTNSNFSELYTAVGPSGNNIVVPGNATITGDLTVDTSTLKVDSANNRVGIQITSPTAPLEVGETSGTALRLRRLTSGNTIDVNFYNTNTTVGDVAGIRCDGDGLSNTFGAISFWTTQTPNSLVERYRISSVGVHTWQNVGGVAGTAMTLNATGLGIGVGPSYPFHLRNSASAIGMIHSTNANGPYVIFQNSTANFGDIGSETAITGGGSAGNLTLNSRSTSNLCFSVNDTVRMRIDSSGNVGIGVTPSAWASNRRALQVGGLAAAALALNGTSNVSEMFFNSFINTSASNVYAVNGRAGLIDFGSGGFGFSIDSGTQTAGAACNFTRAMTLDASGNLLVGTTNTNPAYNAVDGVAVSPTFLSVSNTTGVAGAFNRNNDGIVLYFTRNGTAVGNVSVTTGGTTFNSTSDYRLKESISPLVGGLARVNALKPSIYKWKSDGSSGEGFLAHELAEVVPLAVTGQKDAVKDDGSIEAQGVDLSRVVPILVAAIQELTARVQTLETR